jgi:predicted aldo/keto reductase-like oxidoreductase
MLETRRLGRTGIKASLLGFGGIPIMRVGMEEARDAIAEALSSGVNFIDTARGYGDSEDKIGHALKSLGARPYLASKSPKRDADGMHEDFGVSLAKLGVEFIDIYQVHCVNTDEQYAGVVGSGGALEALNNLKAGGKLGYIGFTTHSLALAAKAVESGLFDTIQVLYNFIEPEAADQVIPRAVEKDIGVLAMKPFAGGCIERCDLALRFALSMPGVIAIPGMATVDEVRRNVEVARRPEALDAGELRTAAAERKRLGTVYCRRCDYCQPCPSEIPIAFAMHIGSIRKRMGDSMMQTDFIKGVHEKVAECTECGECEERCPFDLPVRDLIKEARQTLDEILQSSPDE